jgi:hypothetical protein
LLLGGDGTVSSLLVAAPKQKKHVHPHHPQAINPTNPHPNQHPPKPAPTQSTTKMCEYTKE